MEILFFTVIILLALAIFDAAAIEFGVDSRRDSDDPHAPFIGAH